MQRTFYLLLASSTVVLASCGDLAIAPQAQLSDQDVQALVVRLDGTMMGFLDDVWGSSSVSPSSAGTALGDDPRVWNYSWWKTRDCHTAGSFTAEGNGQRTWDADALTFDVASSGTKTRVGCAHPGDEVTITVDGIGDWTHQRHYLGGEAGLSTKGREPTGNWITTYDGAFDWTKSSGENGSCTYELTSTIDTEANTKTLVGTYCDRVIDRSKTWRKVDDG